MSLSGLDRPRAGMGTPARLRGGDYGSHGGEARLFPGNPAILHNVAISPASWKQFPEPPCPERPRKRTASRGAENKAAAPWKPPGGGTYGNQTEKRPPAPAVGPVRRLADGLRLGRGGHPKAPNFAGGRVWRQPPGQHPPGRHYGAGQVRRVRKGRLPRPVPHHRYLRRLRPGPRRHELHFGLPRGHLRYDRGPRLGVPLGRRDSLRLLRQVHPRPAESRRPPGFARHLHPRRQHAPWPGYDHLPGGRGHLPAAKAQGRHHPPGDTGL